MKHECGCVSSDTHYLVRCPYHAAWDAEAYAAFREKRSVRPEREWRTAGAAEGLV